MKQGDSEVIEEFKELADSVFLLSLNFGWGANILVIKEEDQLVLIDSGYRKTAKIINCFLEKTFNKLVKLIVNTHFHGDHIGGNSIIADGGRMITHKNVEEREFYCNAYETVAEYTVIEVGNKKIEIIPMPYGHSTTDMLIFLRKENIIHVGDMYLSESLPISGIDKRISVYNLLENLIQLEVLIDYETTIISGHGRETRKKDLQLYIQMVKETIELVEFKIKQGWDKRRMQREDVLGEYNKWSGNIEFITKHSWIENICRSYLNKHYTE